MPRVVFFFGGTGAEGSGMENTSFDFSDDVIQIHIAGCQHSQVGGKRVTPHILGGGTVFPDLDVGAKNIRAAFNDDGILDLQALKRNLGDAITIDIPKDGTVSIDKPQRIESIALNGFSRGAVSCFATARHLDDLNIPIDVLADQPVPGNSEASTSFARSEYKKNADLSGCKNIRSLFTLVGAYTKDTGHHINTFFKQMLPKGPVGKTTALLLPFQDHWASFRNRNNLLSTAHLQLQLMKRGYINRTKTVKNIILDNKQGVLNQLLTFYRQMRLSFSPDYLRQSILTHGEKPEIDPAYLEVMQEKANHHIRELGLTISGSRLTLNQATAISALAAMKEMFPPPLETPPLAKGKGSKAFARLMGKSDLLSDSKNTQLVQYKEMCQMVLSNTKKSKAFINIVNSTYAAAQLIIDQIDATNTDDTRSIAKREALQNHAKHYMKGIIEASYQYLTISSPTERQSKEYVDKINRFTETFIKDGKINTHRHMAKTIALSVLNFVLSCALVGLIYRATQGHWVGLQTKSSQRIAAFTNQLLLEHKAPTESEEGEIELELELKGDTVDFEVKGGISDLDEALSSIEVKLSDGIEIVPIGDDFSDDESDDEEEDEQEDSYRLDP